MTYPLTVTFRGMSPSEAVEANVREKAGWLENFSDQILHGRVVVEEPHRHQHQGKIFHVRVELSIRGGTIVVNREAEKWAAHEDVYVAIRDAFDAARRQLEDFDTRRHGVKPRAVVGHPAR